MVRPPQHGAAGPEGEAGAVGERPGGALSAIDAGNDVADRVPGEPPEGEDRPRLGQQPELALEERRAVPSLLRRRSVVRRGASDPGRQVKVTIVEAIVPPNGGGLVREPGLVERTDEERRRAVSREHSAGAIRPVGGRGEPDHYESGAGVSETGNRATPVLVVAELALPLPCHPFAIPDETRAPSAADHFAPNRFEGVGHREGEGPRLLELPPGLGVPAGSHRT